MIENPKAVKGARAPQERNKPLSNKGSLKQLVLAEMGPRAAGKGRPRDLNEVPITGPPSVKKKELLHEGPKEGVLGPRTLTRRVIHDVGSKVHRQYLSLA